MSKKTVRRAIDQGRPDTTASTYAPVVQQIASPSQPTVIDEEALANFTGAYLFGGREERRYRGADAWLAGPLLPDTYTMLVTAPIFEAQDKCILSHYETGIEEILVLTNGVLENDVYRYSINRTQPSLSFPAWKTEVVAIGGDSDGGFIIEESGNNVDHPFTDYMVNEAGSVETWKLRVGKLDTVPQEYQDFFKDWDIGQDPAFVGEFGFCVDGYFYSNNVIFSKHIVVGTNLNVNNRIQTKINERNSLQQMGRTNAGAGFLTTSESGSPRFQATVSDGDPDVWSFVISAEGGQRVINFSTRPTDTGYKLEVGDVEYTDEHVWHRASGDEFGGKIAWFDNSPVIRQSVNAPTVEEALHHLLLALEAYGLIWLTNLGF